MYRTINPSIRRRVGAALIVTVACLALAPAAFAFGVHPPDRQDKMGGPNPRPHITVVADRGGATGSGPQIDTGITVLPPDRVDHLGSNLYTYPQPATVILRPSSASGFDWTSALIGAMAGVGILLAVLAALTMRGRRDVALPS